MEISCQFSMSEPEPDLLQTILCFLEASELSTAACVCGCWHTQSRAHNAVLWRKLLVRRWNQVHQRPDRGCSLRMPAEQRAAGVRWLDLIQLIGELPCRLDADTLHTAAHLELLDSTRCAFVGSSDEIGHDRVVSSAPNRQSGE